MKFLSSSFWKRYSTRCLCWLITIGCYLYLGSRRHLITGMSQKISGRQHLYKCWLLRQLDFELLACNLKINKVRLLSRVNNCTKFSNSGSGAKRSKILSGHQLTNSLTNILTLDYVTWKSIGNISTHYGQLTSMTSLSTLKRSNQNILCGYSFVQRPAFFLAHLTWKFIEENLLSSVYIYIKFNYSQERGSKDVEPTFLSNGRGVHKFSRHFMIEFGRKQQTTLGLLRQARKSRCSDIAVIWCFDFFFHQLYCLRKSKWM